MSSEGSVTRWVTALKGGNKAASQALWERYHRQLVTLARKKLRAASRREADEEDVVQNAFHSFFRGVAGGRFPDLHDRDNLWRLLVVITARKAIKQIARETRMNPEWEETAIAEVVGDEPTPAFAAQVTEEYQRLLDRLGDETLCRVAIWKMEGLTNDEVANQLACSRRTVARKLDTIRIIWGEEDEGDGLTASAEEK
jgi:DNA-directed RNA polymerase specialized sigma24 family protein